MQLEAVDISFDVETGLDETTMPVVEALSAGALPRVLEACDHLSIWIDKVRSHAFKMACDGEKIQGRKLIEKISNRFWTVEAEKKAQKLFGEKVFKKELLSPAQFEKTIGKKASDFTEKFTDRKITGYSLVKASHRGPEASPTSAFEVSDNDAEE